MHDTTFFVQDPTPVRCNRGARDRPFSGVGLEYEPLGVDPDRSGLTLHETGYLPANADWNFPEQYVETSLHTPLRVVDLAKQAGPSVTGFNHAFRTHFGASPARYVTEMRVREAARLLLQSSDSKEAIAEQTGFCNRAHFSRVFKHVTDQAPASFADSTRGPVKARHSICTGCSAARRDTHRPPFLTPSAPVDTISP